MSEGSPKHDSAVSPGSEAEASTPEDGSDEFVERLGDRLSDRQQTAPSSISPPWQAQVIGESSDIRALSPEQQEPADRDEALDEPPPPTPADSVDAFAEFEDEIEGETTRIDDSTLLAEASTEILEDAPAQPFLAVERGKDEGREFVLQEGENGIGRGIDNDVILADVAVSRRHLTITREGDVLRMRDLGSGNGTIVNGKKATSAVLVEGDRIEVGETTLVVRQPGASLGAIDPYGDGQELTDEATIAEFPEPAPDPTPPSVPGAPYAAGPSMTHPVLRGGVQAGSVVIPRPVFVAILAGGALLLTMFGAAVAVLALRDTGDDDASVAVESGSNYDRGVRAYRRGDYQEAMEAFRSAVDEEDEHEDLERYVADATRAVEDERRLREAQELIESNPRSALDLAQQVRQDSPLHDRAQTVIGRAEAAQIAALERDFTAAEERGDLAAMRRAHDAATRVDPDDRRVLEMRRRRAEVDPEFGAGPPPEEEAEEEAEEEGTEEEASEEGAEVAESEEEEEEEQSASSRRRSRRRGRRRGRRGASGEAARELAIRQYLARQFSQGASTARAGARRVRGQERDRLNSLAGKIERFGNLWRRIERASFGPSVTSEMSQAIALDRQIARNSQYRRMLTGRLVNAHLANARRTRDVVRRCLSVRRAIAIDSSNSQARSMSAACVSQAQRLMGQARRQPPRQAIRTYQRVLQLVPPGHPVANSAQSQMGRLRRQHIRDEDQ